MNKKFFFPRADGRIEFSIKFESISKTPSSTKRVNASQRLSA